MDGFTGVGFGFGLLVVVCVDCFGYFSCVLCLVFTLVFGLGLTLEVLGVYFDLSCVLLFALLVLLGMSSFVKFVYFGILVWNCYL